MKKTQTILDDIVTHKKVELRRLQQQKPLVALQANLQLRKSAVRDFAKAVSASSGLQIIAEIKKASPSADLLDPSFNHLAIAQAYQESQLTAAISVLTDTRYFQGELHFIKDVKGITTVPILRKDFIVDEYQIYESYLAEADAVLLIVAILEPHELRNLLEVAQNLGMCCLVEVHSRAELNQAIAAGATCIGINARDLHTFSINKNLFTELAKYIPNGIIKVAESGIEQADDLRRLVKSGANAALIGTTLMLAANKKQKIQELLDFERTT